MLDIIMAPFEDVPPEFRNFSYRLLGGGKVVSNGLSRGHAISRLSDACVGTPGVGIPEGVDLSGLDTTGDAPHTVHLRGDAGHGPSRTAVLRGWRFDGARLDRVSFGPALVLDDCSFRGARLSSVEMSRMTMRNCVFDGAVLDRTRLSGCVIEGGSFAGVGVEGGCWTNQCAVVGASFDRAVLNGLRMVEVSLSGCSFSGARWNGVAIAQGSRPEEPGGASAVVGCDFSGAVFRDTKVEALRISGNDMRGADIRGLSMRRHVLPWPGSGAYRWNHRTRFPLLWPTPLYVPASLVRGAIGLLSG